jgi:hypothetical protein
MFQRRDETKWTPDEFSTDRTSHTKGHERTQIKMKSNVHIFFLHTLFGLSVTEINRLIEMHRSHVSRDIALVRDRFLAGDLEIFSVSDGKKMEADIRLKRRKKERL